MSFNDGLADLIVGLDADGGRFPIGKLDAHLGGVRHLAVSIFLTWSGKLLVQQRGPHKYHSPGLWANTACSHPLWQETPGACATRTLGRELGFEAPIAEFDLVHYEARVGTLIENEVVHCFRGDLRQPPDLSRANRDEVAALAWRDIAEITEEVLGHPDHFAPWFRIYVERGLLSRL